MTTPDLLTAVNDARKVVSWAVLALLEHQLRIEDKTARAEDEAQDGWHLEYLEDELALACRRLTEAVEALPDDGSRPAGWGR